MSLETAMVKANAQDVHYQAFMSELLALSEFEAETLPQPLGEAAVARLHRVGWQYLNLNPYYVLLLEPGCSAEEAKSAYRRMSLQVHPDKHGGDARASAAFEMVKKAYEKVRARARADATRPRRSPAPPALRPAPRWTTPASSTCATASARARRSAWTSR